MRRIGFVVRNRMYKGVLPRDGKVKEVSGMMSRGSNLL